MIEAMIFDLDGTLVQTERLKAISYAKAAVDLCPYSLEEETVIEAFKDVVGRSRREVAEFLVDRFDMAGLAIGRMAEFGVSTPWEAYIGLRLKHYEEMLADPAVLQTNRWPHNLKLLDMANDQGCKTALATMSHRPQVERVLDILDLKAAFDFVATRDDVVEGKPSPEIYELVATRLEVKPENSLVIEDSPSGVAAAVAAGMHVIAVTTPFTQEALHRLDMLDPRWIVDDVERLPQVVADLFNEASDPQTVQNR